MTGVVEYDESVSYIYHIENTGDDGYYLAGIKFEELLEDDEYKILRTDLSGKLIWEKGLGDMILNGFTATRDGGFLIAEVSPDGNTSVVVKYPVDNKSEETPGFGPLTVFAAFIFALVYLVCREKPE